LVRLRRPIRPQEAAVGRLKVKRIIFLAFPILLTLGAGVVVLHRYSVLSNSRLDLPSAPADRVATSPHAPNAQHPREVALPRRLGQSEMSVPPLRSRASRLRAWPDPTCPRLAVVLRGHRHQGRIQAPQPGKEADEMSHGRVLVRRRAAGSAKRRARRTAAGAD
jgi:hypothetical protein